MGDSVLFSTTLLDFLSWLNSSFTFSYIINHTPYPIDMRGMDSGHVGEWETKFNLNQYNAMHTSTAWEVPAQQTEYGHDTVQDSFQVKTKIEAERLLVSLERWGFLLTAEFQFLPAFKCTSCSCQWSFIGPHEGVRQVSLCVKSCKQTETSRGFEIQLQRATVSCRWGHVVEIWTKS